MKRTVTLPLGLALAALITTSATAQLNTGGVPIRPQVKQPSTAQQDARVLRTNQGRTASTTMQKGQPLVKPARTGGHQNFLTRGSAPLNDDCSGAVLLSTGATCNPVTGDVSGATQSIAAILCNGFTGTADDDVWFSFVATAAAMTVEVTGSANFDAVIDLRSGGCNGTNISCQDQTFAGETETLNATGLTVGSTYYVRVFDWFDVAPATTTFDICVFGTPPPPANDNCAGAISLAVGSTCSPVAGSVVSATQSLAAISCNTFTGTADDDVWYSFVATAPNITIDVAGSADFDAVVDLRSGSCNGTNLDCADATVNGGVETINASGLTVGATYLVRVYTYGAGAPPTTTFDICAYVTPLAPVNDICDDATVQNLNSPGSVTVTGDNSGATDNEGVGFNLVWEAFTITECSNVTVDYCGTSPVFGEFVPVLLSDCQFTTFYDTTSTTACPDGNPSMYFDGLAPGTYYYPVVETPLASGPYSITFTAVACPSAPANDECSNAVIQNINVPGTVTVTGDNTGATDSEGLGENSVWEAFTITECADVIVELCGTSPAFGAWFVAMTDDCQLTNIFFQSSSDTCSDGNVSMYFAQLAAGTYYYPVLQDPLVATGPYSVTFTTSVCPAPPANDDCSGAVLLDVEIACTPTTGTTLGATESFPADSCAGVGVGDANDDVWYAFVATGTEHAIDVAGSGNFDAVVQAYSGDCTGLSLIACEDSTLNGEVETMELTNLNIGETYYVRVFHWYSALLPNPEFTICVVGDVATGIEQNAAAAWTVFPNPTDGAITVVNGGTTGKATIELFDVAGRLVYGENTSLAAGAQRTLEPGTLNSGTYTLRVTTATGRSTQRVVVR